MVGLNRSIMYCGHKNRWIEYRMIETSKVVKIIFGHKPFVGCSLQQMGQAHQCTKLRNLGEVGAVGCRFGARLYARREGHAEWGRPYKQLK